MWQRFTENARKAVFYAQEEAQRLGEGYVSTEHLLLGLLRLPECSAVKVLVGLGVDPDVVRQRTVELCAQNHHKPDHDMTLTPRAKRVIDLAYDEARHFDHNYIGTEHLLLGLIREGDGLAGRVLTGMKVELEAVRAQLGVEGGQSQAAPPPRPKARCAGLTLLGLMLADPSVVLATVFERRGLDPALLGRFLSAADYGQRASLGDLLALANSIATERGDPTVTADHVLLAILRGNNSASTMLGGLGIDYELVTLIMDE